MNYRRAVFYALGVWVIPFMVAIAIFPLRANERPLFESIMPVAVVGATTLFAYRYARSERSFARQGLLLGPSVYPAAAAILSRRMSTMRST